MLIKTPFTVTLVNGRIQLTWASTYDPVSFTASAIMVVPHPVNTRSVTISTTSGLNGQTVLWDLCTDPVSSDRADFIANVEALVPSVLSGDATLDSLEVTGTSIMTGADPFEVLPGTHNLFECRSEDISILQTTSEISAAWPSPVTDYDPGGRFSAGIGRFRASHTGVYIFTIQSEANNANCSFFARKGHLTAGEIVSETRHQSAGDIFTFVVRLGGGQYLYFKTKSWNATGGSLVGVRHITGCLLYQV